MHMLTSRLMKNFNAANSRCRNLLMLNIDGCSTQNTGKLEIELLVGQHYRLGILADLASFPFPFVLPGKAKLAELTIEASGLESQV